MNSNSASSSCSSSSTLNVHDVSISIRPQIVEYSSSLYESYGILSVGDEFKDYDRGQPIDDDRVLQLLSTSTSSSMNSNSNSNEKGELADDSVQSLYLSSFTAGNVRWLEGTENDIDE
jgi:hypothetical protein